MGWLIADHIRAAQAVDALEMTRWGRQPPLLVHRTRPSLVPTTAASGDYFDVSFVKSFFGTVQLELLDRQTWPLRGARPGDLRMDRWLVQTSPASTPTAQCSAPTTLKSPTLPDKMRHAHPAETRRETR